MNSALEDVKSAFADMAVKKLDQVEGSVMGGAKAIEDKMLGQLDQVEKKIVAEMERREDELLCAARLTQKSLSAMMETWLCSLEKSGKKSAGMERQRVGALLSAINSHLTTIEKKKARGRGKRSERQSDDLVHLAKLMVTMYLVSQRKLVQAQEYMRTYLDTMSMNTLVRKFLSVRSRFQTRVSLVNLPPDDPHITGCIDCGGEGARASPGGVGEVDPACASRYMARSGGLMEDLL